MGDDYNFTSSVCIELKEGGIFMGCYCYKYMKNGARNWIVSMSVEGRWQLEQVSYCVEPIGTGSMGWLPHATLTRPMEMDCWSVGWMVYATRPINRRSEKGNRHRKRTSECCSDQWTAKGWGVLSNDHQYLMYNFNNNYVDSHFISWKVVGIPISPCAIPYITSIHIYNTIPSADIRKK